MDWWIQGNVNLSALMVSFQVKKMIHQDQEVVIVVGTYPLHQHEKLAVAVSKSMRGHSVHETKNDGRFHVQTKTYVDGAILKEVLFSFPGYLCC